VDVLYLDLDVVDDLQHEFLHVPCVLLVL
jgi:hypothetical protein